LSETLGEELFAAEVAASLPQALRLDAFRSAPPPTRSRPRRQQRRRRAREHAQRSGAAAGCPTNSIREMLEANRSSIPSPPTTARGSNNWIVSPEMSESGFAMLANDRICRCSIRRSGTWCSSTRGPHDAHHRRELPGLRA
jgi:acyl-homoserine lactone acylase PvdQ